jgi:hypothetical protein
MPMESAYQRLKELSGQDFGHDDGRWEEWGIRNGKFLPGYVRGPRSGSDLESSG